MLPIHVVTSDGSPLVTCPTCRGAPCATCHDERKVRAEVAHALEAREGAQRANEAKRAAQREQRIEMAHRVFDYFLAYVCVPFLPVVGAAVFKGVVWIYAQVLGLVVHLPAIDAEVWDNWGIGGLLVGAALLFVVMLISVFEVDLKRPAESRPPWMPSRRRHDRAERRRFKV